MRSALAGTASNVVALKTTAAVPMSVIERMFHLLWWCPQQRCTITQSSSKPDLITQNIFGFLAEHFEKDRARLLGPPSRNTDNRGGST
jgi:hypothetical protein